MVAEAQTAAGPLIESDGKGGWQLTAYGQWAIENLPLTVADGPGWKLSDVGGAFVSVNMGLVYREAHKLKKQKVLGFEELVGEGGLAMARCARTYTPDKGKPSTYCIPAIQRQMWHAIRKRRQTMLPQEPPARSLDDASHQPHLDSLPAAQPPAREAESEPLDPADYLGCLNELQRLVVRWRFGMHNGRPEPFEKIAGKIKHTVPQTVAIYRASVYAMKLAAAKRPPAREGDGDSTTSGSMSPCPPVAHRS